MLAVTAEALLNERVFRRGASFGTPISGRWGRCPQSIYGPGNDVDTTLPLEVFTQRNFVADFFREKLNFTGTNSDIAFLCHPLWGT